MDMNTLKNSGKEKYMARAHIPDLTDLRNMTTEELQAELDALYIADGKKLVDA